MSLISNLFSAIKTLAIVGEKTCEQQYGKSDDKKKSTIESGKNISFEDYTNNNKQNQIKMDILTSDIGKKIGENFWKI